MAAPAKSRDKTRAKRGPGGSTRPPLKGSTTPRVFTPPLRPLEPRTPTTEKHTLGYAAIDFAKNILKVELYPWQEWLLVHALEILPDGTFRFRNVVVLVSRQNGKSTLSQVLSLFFMFVLQVPLVVGTAQDLDVAEEIWQGSVDLVEENPFLNKQKLKVVGKNGSKALVLKDGCRYKVKAANRRAGRGLSGDLILLDELREHQTWDAWGAITKTTMARPEAQVWALSNAGDISSVVLRYLRKMAHQKLGDPDGICAADDPSLLLPDAQQIEDEEIGLLDDDIDLDEDDFSVEDDSLGLFEWSAAPTRSKMDRAGWCEANPSLGYGFITEKALRSSAATDPEWVFRTECLCQWSEGTLQGPFNSGAWEDGLWQPLDTQPNPPQIVGAVKAGIATASDGSVTFIALAGRAEDGRVQVEIAARRAGKGWVEEWLDERVENGVIDEISGQARGSQEATIMEALGKTKLPTTPLQGADLPLAHTALFDAVHDNTFRHLPWPELDVAAATAVTKGMEGGAKLFDDKRSPTDIAALRAVVAALWLQNRPKRAKMVSAYENRGVLTI